MIPQTLGIRPGDRVTFKPEWRDEGDEDIDFVAVENDDGGRVRVEAKLSLPFNPQSTVHLDMIETVNGVAVTA